MNMEIVALFVVLIPLVVAFIYYAYQDMIRLKNESKKRIDWMNRTVKALEEIARTGKTCQDITYVEELRMYHSCVDCQLLAQCQSDADVENVPFDYLVCEEFREVVH